MSLSFVKNTVRTLLAGSLALGMVTAPALARGNDHSENCGRGQRCIVVYDKGHKKDDHGRHDKKDDHRRYDRDDRYERDSRHDNRDGRKFYRLSEREYHHLPRLPRGESYRRDGDRVVRINDNTGAVLAMLGLFTALTVTR